jgi:hypothetical protein
MKILAIFTLIVLAIFSLAAWSLRPQQAKPVNPQSFRLGEKDPFFYLLFNSAGLPRKYSWCIPLAIATLFLAALWLGWIVRA